MLLKFQSNGKKWFCKEKLVGYLVHTWANCTGYSSVSRTMALSIIHIPLLDEMSCLGPSCGDYSFVLLEVDFTLCCLRTKCGWQWACHSVKDIESKFELKAWDSKSSVLRNTLTNFVQNCEKHVCLRGTSDGQISSFLWKGITGFYIRFQLITNNRMLNYFHIHFLAKFGYIVLRRWWQLRLHYKFLKKI